MKGVLAILMAAIIWLVVADVVGVIACFVMDVAPLRSGSSALPFAIWGVLGVFCGLSIYQTAGMFISKGMDENWVDGPGSVGKGTRIIIVTAVLLVALSWLFNSIWWRYHPSGGEFFVPDTASVTLTFFVAILATMVGFRSLSKPGPPKPKQRWTPLEKAEGRDKTDDSR